MLIVEKGIYTLNDRNGNMKCVIRILNVKDESQFILKYSLYVCLYIHTVNRVLKLMQLLSVESKKNL